MASKEFLESSEAGEQVELQVLQDEGGTCYVEEKNHSTGEVTQIAVFPAQTKVVTVKGKFGPELAQQDAAQIRAVVFTKIMAALISGQQIDFGQ